MYAFYIYWGFTAFTFILFLTTTVLGFAGLPQFIRVYLVPLLVLIIISKLIGSVFLAVDDIIRLFRWIGTYIFKAPVIETMEVVKNPHAISRLKFLNYIAVGMAALPFASFIYGMVKGAFDYTIHNQKVVLPNLPSEFNGLKIVQISDIHSGSFVSTKPSSPVTYWNFECEKNKIEILKSKNGIGILKSEKNEFEF